MFLCDVVPSVMDDKSEQNVFPYWYEGKLAVAAWRVGNQSKNVSHALDGLTVM